MRILKYIPVQIHIESGVLMRTFGKAIVLGLLLVLAGMVMYFAVGTGN